jgi:hypothetical protein
VLGGYVVSVSKPRQDAIISVRVTADEADELRLWAKRTGRYISDFLREGMHYPLERLRADWLEEHRGDPEAWGEVTAVQRVPARKLDMVFGVRMSGEQLRDLMAAAEVWDMPLSRFLREAGLAVAGAMAEGGTAHCPHASVGSITDASCQDCGPMPVSYVITRQAS